MGFLREFFPPMLREWVEAITVAAITLISIGAFRTFIGAFRKRKGGRLVWELTSYFINLGYVIGLRAFLDVAPLPPKTILWLDNGAYVATVFILLSLIRHAAFVGIELGSSRNGQATTQTLQQGFLPLTRNLITLFVFTSGGIMVLKHFDYDVLSLITALGVGSLAVGLAAKETLSNMISGFMLIIDRNLRPGDRVSLAGWTGDVEVIGLRSTRIRTGDGNTLIVPNFDLVNTKFVNYSEPGRGTTCTTQIRVPYTVEFQTIKDLSLKILDQIPKADHDRGKWVNLSNLAEGYQLISIGCWIKEMDDAGSVQSDFNEKLLSELHSRKIPLIEAADFQPTLKPS